MEKKDKQKLIFGVALAALLLLLSGVIEGKLSHLSRREKQNLAIIADIASVLFGFVPFLNILVGFVLSLIAIAVWGKVGFLNVWELAAHSLFPSPISGMLTIIPTLSFIHFLAEEQSSDRKRIEGRSGIVKHYRLRPGVKEFFRNPRGLVEKKVRRVKKFFNRHFRLRPEARELIENIKKWNGGTYHLRPEAKFFLKKIVKFLRTW